MSSLDHLKWRTDERLVLLERLARRSGLARAADAGERLSELDLGHALGVDLHGVRTRYGALPQLVRQAGPAVITCFDADGLRAFGLLGPADLLDRVRVLAPDGRVHRVPVHRLVHALRAGIEASEAPVVDGLVHAANLPARRARKVRERLLSARLAERPMGGGTLLRAAPSGDPGAIVRDARVLAPLGLSVVAAALGSVVSLLGWIQVGQGALDGKLEPGWVAGWALILMSGLALERLSSWQQARLSIRGGAWMKAALLRGTLAADPEQFRRDGVGGMLARIHESQAIEDLVLTGGLGLLMTALNLLVGLWALSQAPAAPALLGLLGLALAWLGVVAVRIARRHDRWTEHRRHLTDTLVERMNGHRTRLIQGDPAHWYDGEDEALAAYLDASIALDGPKVNLDQVLASGVLLAGLGVVGGSFVAGDLSTTQLAVALGALLWVQAALTGIAAKVHGLIGARTAWRQVGPILRAARQRQATAQVAAHSVSQVPPGQPLLRVQDASFAWPDRPPTLQDVQFTLHRGDRVVLTGTSGSGKSTLTHLLAGDLTPTDGVVLLGGLDRAALGPAAWRRHVVAAPQFHDNHLFEHSLLFNVLLGGDWPPSPDDIRRARQLLTELGLGPLLERMPGGMQQTVGESGWQLSHGERSRVFLARALLQGAGVVILDESFAALDPHTLEQCLAVAQRHAETLIIVAHP